MNTCITKAIGCIHTTNYEITDQVIIIQKETFVSFRRLFQDVIKIGFIDSANDMNTNAYKAAIHKVHERTIYEPSNALPFYVRDCGGGWACFESRHKDWRFYYLSVNTRLTEPEVVMEWSLNPMVSYYLYFKHTLYQIKNVSLEFLPLFV